MAGLTSSGFVKKTQQDCKTDIETLLKNAFGTGINLQAPSVLAVFVGIVSAKLAELWDAGEDVYNSQYPDTAAGVSLDNVSAITGTEREGAKYSLASGVTLTGTPFTTIAAGKQLSVSGNPQAKFQLLADVTLDSGGHGTGNFQCTVPGAVLAPTGSLTVIETPVAGWSSATNPTDAVVGADIEADPALRTRRQDELSKSGAGAVESIRQKLLTVSGVKQAIVFENDTSATDGNGLPPNSIRAYVQGGVNADIANELWLCKGGGIYTDGAISVGITDSVGRPKTIRFSRPTAKPVYVVVTVVKDATLFPSDGATQIKNLIAAAGNLLNIGDDVIPYPYLLCSFAGIPGIVSASMILNFTAPNPGDNVNLVVAINELATFDTANITVNVS